MWYRTLRFGSEETPFPITDGPSQPHIVTLDEREDFFKNMMGSISLNNYIAFLFVLTEAICLVYLLNRFLEPRFKRGRLMSVLTTLLYFGAVQYSTTLGGIWNVAAHFMILTVFAMVLYKGTASKKSYLIITFWALVSLCGSFGFYIAKFTKMHYGGFYFHDVVLGNIPNWPFYDSEFLPGLGFEIILETDHCLGLALICIILVLSTGKLARSTKNTPDTIHKKELLFLLMPSITGLIVYLFLEIEKKFLFFQTAVDWATEYGIVLYTLVPLLILTTILCILYAYDIYRQLVEYVEEKGRAVFLEQEMGQMQNHISEIEQLYTGIRSVKHDMQNYLFDVKSLLAAQGISVGEGESELGNYLAGIGKSLDTFTYSLHTGNPVTDVVLNGKYKQAEALGISYDCSFLFPSRSGISAFDISIILNNALNNALEACRNLKAQDQDAVLEIEISSYSKHHMFFIVIKNTFDGILNRNPSDFSLATRKKDSVWHGLGFQNIRKSAEKYLGSADYEVRDRLFILTVMLQMGEPDTYSGRRNVS